MLRVLLLLLAFAILCYWCVTHCSPEIEQDVLANVQTTLQTEGIVDVYPTIDGRDVLLTGQLDTDEQRLAVLSMVQATEGVRVVDHTLALTPKAFPRPEPIVVSEPETEPEPELVAAPEPQVEPEVELIAEPPGLPLDELKVEIKWINNHMTISGYMPDHQTRNSVLQAGTTISLSDNLKTTKLDGEWPKHWATIAANLIKQLQNLEDGTAYLTPGKIIIIGRASDNDSREQLEQGLRRSLSNEWIPEFHIDVPLSQKTVACETEIQNKLDSETINFELARSQIKPESHKLLLTIIDSIQKCETASFLIEGHTDDLGNEAFNQQLSEYRAFAVKKFLVANGVDAERIQIKGYGSSRPIADNSTKQGRAENRRIEIVVLGESQ